MVNLELIINENKLICSTWKSLFWVWF